MSTVNGNGSVNASLFNKTNNVHNNMNPNQEVQEPPKKKHPNSIFTAAGAHVA